MERGTKNLLRIVSGLLTVVLALIPITVLIINREIVVGFPQTYLVLVYGIYAIVVPAPLILASYEIFKFAGSDPNIDMSDDEARKEVGTLLVKLGRLFKAETVTWSFVIFIAPMLMESPLVVFMLVLFGGLLGFYLLGILLMRIGNYMQLTNEQVEKLREEREKRDEKPAKPAGEKPAGAKGTKGKKRAKGEKGAKDA